MDKDLNLEELSTVLSAFRGEKHWVETSYGSLTLAKQTDVEIEGRTRKMVLRETRSIPKPLENLTRHPDAAINAWVASTIPDVVLARYLYSVGIGFGGATFSHENSLLNLRVVSQGTRSFFVERVQLDAFYRDFLRADMEASGHSSEPFLGELSDKFDFRGVCNEFLFRQEDGIERSMALPYEVMMELVRGAKAYAMKVARHCGAPEDSLISGSSVSLYGVDSGAIGLGGAMRYGEIILKNRLVGLLRGNKLLDASLECPGVGMISLCSGTLRLKMLDTTTSETIYDTVEGGMRRAREYTALAARAADCAVGIHHLVGAAEEVWEKYPPAERLKHGRC